MVVSREIAVNATVCSPQDSVESLQQIFMISVLLFIVAAGNYLLLWSAFSGFSSLLSSQLVSPKDTMTFGIFGKIYD